MRLDVLETVNDPGKPGMTGDDRVGFDAAAGTAWALDGATDVTDLRPFPHAESGAAWIAGALSDRLMNPPAPGEAPYGYFGKVLGDVRHRAIGESKISLDSLPGEARPIASGMWMHLVGEQATFAWMGDCIAFHSREGTVTVIGSPDKADDETDVARVLLAGTPEARMAHLHASRRRSNEQGTVFGLDPRAATNLQTRSMAVAPGDLICMMSDGMYRLVSPYATHTPESLMNLIATHGLGAAVTALRSFESSPDRDMPRLKARDDASAVVVRLEP